jgi:hypothetical protein
VRAVKGGRRVFARAEEASEAARRTASGILQVMSGLRTPAEVCAQLGVSVNRYYQLETRGLEGLLASLEPRARGPGRRPDVEIERLRREKAKAEREAARYLALLRASQKALGTAPPASAAKAKAAPGRRRRGRRDRAKALIAALVRPAAPATAGPPPTAGAGAP